MTLEIWGPTNRDDDLALQHRSDSGELWLCAKPGNIVHYWDTCDEGLGGERAKLCAPISRVEVDVADDLVRVVLCDSAASDSRFI